MTDIIVQDERKRVYNLPDVIHFYLGCKMMVRDYDNVWIEDEMIIIFEVGSNECEVWGNQSEMVRWSDIKPILRDDFDLNESEYAVYKSLCKRELEKNNKGMYQVLTMVDTPESFAWLIINHFDVFELIKFGQAVNRKAADKLLKKTD